MSDEAVLIGTTTVLHFAGENLDADLVKFVGYVPDDPDDDVEYRRYLLTMERHLWLDFGSPANLTVEIKPGDLLNDPAELRETFERMIVGAYDEEDAELAEVGDPTEPDADDFVG
jgi:hypothetical protein